MKTVLFLHLPKTAGQSLHSFFLNTFGTNNVCPARTMEQLSFLSLPFLRRYRVFSGHFDWDAVGSVSGDNFVFTVLRDPFERLLSFYFYLREIGLRNNGKSGVKGADLAATLHPDEFFWKFPNDEVQNIVFNHFDNFYTFYFSTRRYNARSIFTGHQNNFDLPVRYAALNVARENLGSVDLILPFEGVSRAPAEFAKVFPECSKVTELRFINKNLAYTREARFDELKKLGASDWLFDILSAYCNLDDELVREFCPAPPKDPLEL